MARSVLSRSRPAPRSPAARVCSQLRDRQQRLHCRRPQRLRARHGRACIDPRGWNTRGVRGSARRGAREATTRAHADGGRKLALRHRRRLGSDIESSVERAQINPDGSLGSFALVSGHARDRRAVHAAIVVGPFLYVLGGQTIARSVLRDRRRRACTDRERRLAGKLRGHLCPWSPRVTARWLSSGAHALHDRRWHARRNREHGRRRRDPIRRFARGVHDDRERNLVHAGRLGKRSGGR